MKPIQLSPPIVLCAVLAAFTLLPAAAPAAPASEEYVLDFPTAGEKGGDVGSKPASAGGRSKGNSKAITGIAADSANDGGLPILLLVLGGTAAAGAGIAIVRRRRA